VSTAQPGTSAADGDDVPSATPEEPVAVEFVPVEPVIDEPETGSSRFKVNLANFTGPFDLLLQLIGKHKLDVTEVALHTVTDEFIAYIRAMGDDWDLDEVSEFLVVASTLLDLKAARLLPSASVEDEEDLALLEARDLLFARLLQYKAYKEAALHLSQLESSGARRWPRAVTLEPQYAQALPELVLGIGPQRLADLALAAMRPKILPTIGIAHVHMERVSVREHAAVLRDKLIRQQIGTFRALCSDCQSTLEIVARFLALLELYREGLISFDQVEALGELTVRWTGPTDTPVDLEVDEYAGSAPEAAELPRQMEAELAAESVELSEASLAGTGLADTGFVEAAPSDLPTDDAEVVNVEAVNAEAVDAPIDGSTQADLREDLS